jgi:Tol biopolymer transport system component
MSFRTVLMTLSCVACSLAQSTVRASVTPNGFELNAASGESAVSADGRYVAFTSDATNMGLVTGQSGREIYLRDMITGTVELVSVSAIGAYNYGGCDSPVMTPDARYVAFESLSPTLVAGDTNGAWDVFVRDRLLGTTTRVSVGPGGAQVTGGQSWSPTISDDGRYVAFFSSAQGLVPGFGSAGVYQVYVHDRQTGQTLAGSVNQTGGTPNADCRQPCLSADGRFLSFETSASDILPGDTNGLIDVYVRDLLTNGVVRATLAPGGIEPNNNCVRSRISGDGRWVAFQTQSTNLVAAHPSATNDCYVRDLLAGGLSLASVSSAGVSVGVPTVVAPQISYDGRYVAFATYGINPLAWLDVFVHDRLSGVTTLATAAHDGADGNGPSPAGVPTGGNGSVFAMSPNGRFVTFDSTASNLVLSDTNGVKDTFLRDLGCAVSYNAFGLGLAGSGGHVPVLSGLEGACNGGSTLFAAHVAGGAPGYLGFSTTLPAVPVQLAGGLVYLPIGSTALLAIQASGPAGVAGAGFWSLPPTDFSPIQGATFYLQAAFLDPGAVAGLSFTNALTVEI